MINSIKLIDETVQHTRQAAGFTIGELSMLLDIYNGTLLSPNIIQLGAGLELQVSDSFVLYPGMYEDKWKVEKEEMIGKIKKLTEWQAACITIWACDFWASGCYADQNSVPDYITGKTSAGHKLIEAYRHTQSALGKQDQFKGTGVKSKLIAQARNETAEAVKILEQLID